MPNKPAVFSIMETECDGYPVVATIASNLRGYSQRNVTPWFLGFSTHLVDPDPRGLPKAGEAEELNRWEDQIEEQIKARSKSIFVGRVTWKGNRELLYYVDNPEQVLDRLQRLADEGSTRPFAIRCELDAEWSNVSIYVR